jgi:hypothetical protein
MAMLHDFGLAFVALLAASAATSVVLLWAGWQRASRCTDVSPEVPAPPLAFGLIPLAGARLDLALEVRQALSALAVEAARRGVRLEMAVPPDVSLRGDRAALQGMLARLVCHALQGGVERVLVTAWRQGGDVLIAVTDDGADADPARLASALREVAAQVASQGGAMEQEPWPGAGHTVVVRLPDAAAAAHGPTAARGDAAVWRLPDRRADAAVDAGVDAAVDAGVDAAVDAGMRDREMLVAAH